MKKIKLLNESKLQFFSLLKNKYKRNISNKRKKNACKINLLNNMINHIKKLDVFSQKMKIKLQERKKWKVNFLVKLFIKILKNKIKIRKIINKSKTIINNRKLNNNIKNNTIKFLSNRKKLKMISDWKENKSKKKIELNKYYISNKIKKISNLKNKLKSKNSSKIIEYSKYYYSYAKNKLKKDLYNFSIKNNSKFINNSNSFYNSNNSVNSSLSINKKLNNNKKLNRIKLNLKTFKIINNN